MSLSKETVDVLKACHPLLKEGREVVGKAFYNKLFEQHPQVVPWCLWWWWWSLQAWYILSTGEANVSPIRGWKRTPSTCPIRSSLQFSPLSICATTQSKQAINRCQVTQWLPQITNQSADRWPRYHLGLCLRCPNCLHWPMRWSPKSASLCPGANNQANYILIWLLLWILTKVHFRFRRWQRSMSAKVKRDLFSQLFGVRVFRNWVVQF